LHESNNNPSTYRNEFLSSSSSLKFAAISWRCQRLSFPSFLRFFFRLTVCLLFFLLLEFSSYWRLVLLLLFRFLLLLLYISCNCYCYGCSCCFFCYRCGGCCCVNLDSCMWTLLLFFFPPVSHGEGIRI
jgi:hypothetical protein